MIEPKPEPEPIIVPLFATPPPHHHSQFAADIAEPSYGELIRDRRVLDLMPVIEDQTFDPFWDQWGSFDMEQNIAAARSQRKRAAMVLYKRRHGT